MSNSFETLKLYGYRYAALCAGFMLIGYTVYGAIQRHELPVLAVFGGISGSILLYSIISFIRTQHLLAHIRQRPAPLNSSQRKDAIIAILLACIAIQSGNILFQTLFTVFVFGFGVNLLLSNYDEESEPGKDQAVRG